MINKHVLIFVGFSQPYVWPPLYLLVHEGAFYNPESTLQHDTG